MKRAKKVKNYQQGGPVHGPGTPTSDSILARLSNGEYVLPAMAVPIVGLQNLERARAMANQQTRGYALGGMVDDPPAPPPMASIDAYKAARAGADTLDVASGRFDREYVPRFAGGGTVVKDVELLPRLPRFVYEGFVPRLKEGGMVLEGEWERLPRFEQGGFNYSGIPIDPNQQRQLQEEAANAARNRINQMSAGNVPIESSYYGVGATPRPNIQPSLPKMAAPGQPVSVAATPGIERQQPGTLPAMPGESQPSQPTFDRPSPAQDAARRMSLRQLTAGLDRGALVAGGATQLPGTDVYRTMAPAPGFGPANPNRVPAPGQVAGTTTYTAPGSSVMGGGAPGYATFHGLPKQGGSLGYVDMPETAGMTQEQATAYNVAAINRQIAALQGLNQARVGGDQPGGYGGLDAQDLMRMSNPFYAPGQSYGDEVLNRDRFMRQFPTNTGRSRKTLADVEQNLAQAQAARMQGLAQLMPKGGAQPGISPYQMEQLTNDRERLALDRARYRSDAEQKAMDRQATAEQKAHDYASKLPKTQLQQATNELLAGYRNAVNAGNKEEAAKLERLIQVFGRYHAPEDFASLLQAQNP